MSAAMPIALRAIASASTPSTSISARAAVELAKDWRTDRYLRRLEAMMIVADKDVSLVLTGTGDVLEPEAGVMAIGDRKSTRLNSSHRSLSRMPSSA